MSDLLKEAIADAKAVRATALANAKAALEESFKPTLEAMLAEKLKSEIGMEDEAVHSSDIGKGKGVASFAAQASHQDPGGDDHVEKVYEESEEEVTSEELDEILAELEREMGDAPTAPALAPTEPAAEIPAPAPVDPMMDAPAPEAPVASEEVEEYNEEINLQELLDTLSEEVQEVDEAKKQDSEEEDDDKEEVKEQTEESVQ